MTATTECYTVDQIREAFAKHASRDSWTVPSFYEDVLIEALRGKYDDSVAANKRGIRTGGLYRCCLATYSESDIESKVGTVLSCKYESDPNNEQMIVASDGIWEWNH